MQNPAPRCKQFLFLDDDTEFLADIRDVFMEMSRGTWKIFTAQNHAQALELLRRHRIDLLVLDFNMPALDGLQFLRLLRQTHPHQNAVILSGRTTDQERQACLEAGAAMVLQKAIAPDGFATAFATLDTLAAAAPQEGFRGVMRRVDLQDVLQMECLARKNSILEVLAGEACGRIFIAEGQIVHAEASSLQGEVALYALLGITTGEFNLLPFSEPARRTISGQYEFLLMEAARLKDEGTQFFAQEAGPNQDQTGIPEFPAPDISASPAQHPQPTQTREVLLCSGAGEVLHAWECKSVERRASLLRQVEHQATEINGLLPSGRFDRVEILTLDGRAICQLRPQMRLFLHTSFCQPPPA